LQVNSSCTILRKDHPNDHAIRFTLDVGSMITDSFTGPGQFVHIKCGEERLLRRPISVCACTKGSPDTLTIVFEVRGTGTDWLAQREVGDKLDVLGLLGHGFQMESEGRYLLVGGGIGVPPMLGCAQYAGIHRCDVVLGFRDEAHMLLDREFQACCGTVAVATEDGSVGMKGFVTGPMEELLKHWQYKAVLACGPKPMLKAVAALAAQYGLPCQVSMEERMACGVGACLGCATPMTDGTMKHVCKDGPVFNASEVDWNG